MTDTDHRENLFRDYKIAVNNLKDVTREMDELHALLQEKKKQASENERLVDKLWKTVNMVLVEECDPIVARFKVDEPVEDIKKGSALRLSPGVYIEETDISYRIVQGSKIRRMVTACMEIWKNG